MIVITHFAAYCLTFIWKYLKQQYAKQNIEKNITTLKDITENELILDLTVNNFDNENLCKEIDIQKPNNFENNSFKYEEHISLAENDLKNSSFEYTHKELSNNSKIDSVERSLHMQEVRSKPIDKETVTLSPEKYQKVQQRENQFVSEQGCSNYTINDLEPHSQTDTINLTFTEWGDGEIVNSSTLEDNNITGQTENYSIGLYNKSLTKGNLTNSSQDYEYIQECHDKPVLGLDQHLDITHDNVSAVNEFDKNNDYFNKDNKDEEHIQDSSLSKVADGGTIPIPASSLSDVEVKTNLRFYPPVFVQRYVRVGAVLNNEKWKKSIKKVVEFGCSEMGFFTMVLKYTKVTEIIQVDIDHDLLDRYMTKVSPKPSDFLEQRSTPLTVKVYAGNVAKINTCLNDTDAVIAIELIEHLYPDDLEGLPFTIFGYMQPRLAVFTTPNADFNVLFPNFSGFRHYDHKFEWTREQFEDWGHNLVSRYPNYEVSFEGIGNGPEGTETLGCCSQMALFVRKTEYRTTVEIVDNKDLEGDYKLINDAEYPFYIDTRTEEQKILHSAETYIYRRRNGRWYGNENSEILLKDVLSHVKCLSLVRLRDILVKANWEVSKSSTGDLMVKIPETEDDTEDWDVDDNLQEQAHYFDSSAANHNIEENWDDLEYEKPLDDDHTSHHSEDITESFFNMIQEIESSKNVAQETSTEQYDSENDTTIQNETTLSTSSESYTPQQNSTSLSNLQVACEINQQNSSPSTKKYSVSPKPNALYNLPTYQSSIVGQQIAYTPLNTPSEKRDCDNFFTKNLSCLSDSINDSNVSSIDLSNAFRSCSDGSESEIFYTPMPLLKHIKKDGQIPSFKNAISVSDLNESEDSLSPSDNNISFTNLKSQIPKCHSCPGSRQSVSAEELQRGSSCDILACQQDSISISKAGDSGYPNSNSEQTMDMDLTPEQVDELFTESDSSLGCDDNSLPQSPVNLAAGQIIALLGDNVENGDVANNNRDGEGNNVIGEIDGALFEFEAVIDEREEVHPLLAAVEGDLDSSDNELFDENKNSEHNENDESQDDLNIDNPQTVSSSVITEFSTLNSKSLMCSDLPSTKSEPILVGNSTEKSFSNVLMSSTSECSNISRPTINSEPHLVEKASENSSSNSEETDNFIGNLSIENDNIEDISPTTSSSHIISNPSKSSLCTDSSLTKLEPAVVGKSSNKLYNQLSSLSSDQISTSSRLLNTSNNKTKNTSPIHSSYSEVENLAKYNPNFVLCSDRGSTHSELILIGKRSEKSLNELLSSTSDQTVVSNELKCIKNDKTEDISKYNSKVALYNDQDGTILEPVHTKKSLQKSCDDLPCSSSNQTICSKELFTIECDESRSHTLLSSSSSAISDISKNYSNVALYSDNSDQTISSKEHFSIECDESSSHTPLVSSSSVINDISKHNSNIALYNDHSDQTVCSKELFSIECDESRSLTPLPSACAIIEDLSIKDSQMTLCSEISSTVESILFETSSESSFHELIPDSFDYILQSDSDIELPDDANPFPDWLLNILNNSVEDNFVELGYGDIEEENNEIVDEEREMSYDVEGDLGGGGDPNTSQS